MGVWKAQVVSVSGGKTGELEKQLAVLLNDGWKIKGYSVVSRVHYALLVKETKEDKD